MNSEAEQEAEVDQRTKLDRFREWLATWTTFAALLVFFTVSIAIWGWAVWQSGVYLVGLVF